MLLRSLPWRRVHQSANIRRLVRQSSATVTVSKANVSLSKPNKPDTSTKVSQPNPDTTAKARAVPPSYLAFHWDTPAANASQLARAASFFTKHAPTSLFFASKLHTIPITSIPEVAFIGRSNVGKSSLLNALLGARICHTSSKPGRTRSMNAFAVGGPDGMGNTGRVTVLDMPGYGKGSREEWGKEITKYLLGRKELKRVFFLVDPLHGLKETDRMMLTMLRHNGVPHQIVLNKVDRILLPDGRGGITQKGLMNRRDRLRQIVEDLKPVIQPKNDGPPALGEILACSTDMGRYRTMSTETSGTLGINALRWGVLVATGMSGTNKKLYEHMTSTAAPVTKHAKHSANMVPLPGSNGPDNSDLDEVYGDEINIDGNEGETVNNEKKQAEKLVAWKPT